MLLAGVDGCKSGWLCVFKDTLTGAVSGRVINRISDLLDVDLSPDIAMIDIPIGLPDSGSREPDLAARAYLGSPRASSVFPCPIRPVLKSKSYEDACSIGLQTDGRKLSKQSWAILPKIKEVDDFLSADITRQRWLREVHPEVCFAVWNGGAAMVEGKKTLQGQEARRALVESIYGNSLRSMIQSPFGRGFAMDDLLDAFAALWTCERVVEGRARTFPLNPKKDSVGLVMEMIA
jgi:predicted RNase H-like nuclease